MVCVPRHKLYTPFTDRGSGNWCSRTRWLKPSVGKVAIQPVPWKEGDLFTVSSAQHQHKLGSWLSRQQRLKVSPHFLYTRGCGFHENTALCPPLSLLYRNPVTAPEWSTPIIRMGCNIVQTPTLGLYTVRARGEESLQQLRLVRFACLPHTQNREYVVLPKIYCRDLSAELWAQ